MHDLHSTGSDPVRGSATDNLVQRTRFCWERLDQRSPGHAGARSLSSQATSPVHTRAWPLDAALLPRMPADHVWIDRRALDGIGLEQLAIPDAQSATVPPSAPR